MKYATDDIHHRSIIIITILNLFQGMAAYQLHKADSQLLETFTKLSRFDQSGSCVVVYLLEYCINVPSSKETFLAACTTPLLTPRTL